ncbi:phage tail sheath family protein [Chitinimonas lacunae]|uniref:Phage tail sheath family protein n=1 Tax=Chitinimonas lacunae TaxID=1963018 RepID=A0ABV8MNL5_9NEIS
MRYATPGVSIERTDAASVEPIVLRTDITGFVGLAERGPLDTPLPVESWRQFQAHFGEPLSSAYLAHALRGFFDNGGRRAWVVRVAARQFGADGDLAFEAAGGACRAARLIHDTAGRPCWRIAASSPGSWGNGLSIAIRRERPQTQAARQVEPGAVVLASTAGFAVGELVRLSQPGRPAAYRVLVQLDPGSHTLYWVHPDPLRRDPGQTSWHGHDPARPLLVERVAYALALWRNGRFIAQYRDLHPAPQHPRHIGTLLRPPYPSPLALLRMPPNSDGNQAAPSLIQVEVLGSGPSLPVEPDADGPLWLTGGADGLAALGPDDFIGAPCSPLDGDLVRLRALRGLQALSHIDEISLLAIPDILIRPEQEPVYLAPPAPPSPSCRPCPPPEPVRRPHQPLPPGELPPSFDEAAVLRVQTALIVDCEARGDRFALLSLPYERATDPRQGPRAAIEWRGLLTEHQAARQAALYSPWLAIAGQGGRVRWIPPCGHIAGAIARTDLSRGVMRAPANLPLSGVVDLRIEADAVQHGQLNQAGVNVLRAPTGREPLLLGARTVSDEPEWRYVNTVRMVLALKRAFAVALRWAVFEPAALTTRDAVVSTLTAILTLFHERGAFAGATPAESFFVRSEGDGRDGRLIALVGIAPVAPAEFIVLRVGRQDNLPVVTLAQDEALLP